MYGPIDYEERQGVWKLICERRENMVETWMCIGDFNDILYNFENEGGKIRDERKTKGFR